MKNILNNLSGIQSVNQVKIKNKIIEFISLKNKSIGRLVIKRLEAKDSPALFDFYFKGLSKKNRNHFPPYPLFSPQPKSSQELREKIIDWQKENDWTVLKLTDTKQIIGICLLKRYRTKRPTSGLAIRKEFQKLGLGTLLQVIINEQVKLLNLKKLYISLAPDNIASLRLHEKCGFKQTGKLVPHYAYEKGNKKIDRYDIEMIKEFNYE